MLPVLGLTWLKGFNDAFWVLCDWDLLKCQIWNLIFIVLDNSFNQTVWLVFVLLKISSMGMAETFKYYSVSMILFLFVIDFKSKFPNDSINYCMNLYNYKCLIFTNWIKLENPPISILKRKSKSDFLEFPLSNLFGYKLSSYYMYFRLLWESL